MINKIRHYLEAEGTSSAKAAVYYLMCNFFTKGFVFISTPIFSRIMSKEDFGNVGNFTAWVGILTPIITLDLNITISRSKYIYRNNNDKFLSTILITSNIVTLICLVIVEVNAEYFSALFNMEMSYIRIMFWYILFSTALDFKQSYDRIYNKYRLYTFYTICSVFLCTITSIVLVQLLDDKYAGRIIGMTLPACAIDLLILLDIIKKGKSYSFDFAKKAIFMAVPLIPYTLSATVLNSSDKIMITNFCGSSQTALYTIAYSVSSIASVFWSSLNQAWGPWLFDNLDKGNNNAIKKVSKQFFLLYSFVVIGLMLVAPEIVLVMGGKSYYEAIGVMPPVILAMVFIFLQAFYSDIAYFYGETFTLSLGTLIGAVVNLVLNYCFIPRYGYISAAYTTLIGYVVIFVYKYLLVRYKLKKHYIYDTKFFAAIVGGLFLAQLLAGIMYNYPIMRAVILLAYSGFIVYILFTFRKKIIEFLKNKFLS